MPHFNSIFERMHFVKWRAPFGPKPSKANVHSNISSCLSFRHFEDFMYSNPKLLLPWKVLHVFIGTFTRYNFQRLVFQFTQMLTTITYHLYCHKAHSALGYVQSTTVLSNTKLKMRTFLLCLAPLTSNTVGYKQGGPSIRLQVEKV